MAALSCSPIFPQVFAKQIGWQEVIIRLFILQPKAIKSSVGRSDPRICEILHPQRNHSRSTLADDHDQSTKGFDGDNKAVSSLCSVNYISHDSELSHEDLPQNRAQSQPQEFLIRQGAFQRDVGLNHSASLKKINSQSDESQRDENQEPHRMEVLLQGNEDVERSEELSQNLLTILFTLMWKGVEGSDEMAWKVSILCFAKPCFASFCDLKQSFCISAVISCSVDSYVCLNLQDNCSCHLNAGALKVMK